MQPASTAAAAARETPDAEPEALAEIKDGDIDLVVNTALQTTADFPLRDINDLLHLAEALPLPLSVTGACRPSRDALQMIVSPSKRLDQALICQTLSRAEAAIVR